jgi:hypothetical protein
LATETERQRLRLDLGLAADDTTNLSDTKADDLFDEAGEIYTDTASIKAATRVIAISRLLIQAAADVDYTQNNNSRKASQRYQHLSNELAKWQVQLEEATAANGGGAARFGSMRQKPARVKEYPNA